MHCEFWKRVAFKETQPGVVVMVRLRCGSWQCDFCAKENRKEWRKHLRKVLPQITDNWWFVTLTSHERLRDDERSLANIRSNMDRLIKRVRRVWKSVEYIRVYERHKKQGYHAHLLVSGLSPFVEKLKTPAGVEYFRPSLSGGKVGFWQVKTWFKRTARDLEMGYMVDVQTLEGLSHALSYVLKYLTKAAQEFYVKNLRRIQTTRRIGSPRSAGDGSWTSQECMFRGNLPQGARLYDASVRVWVSEQYWSENITYPKPNSSP